MGFVDDPHGCARAVRGVEPDERIFEDERFLGANAEAPHELFVAFGRRLDRLHVLARHDGVEKFVENPFGSHPFVFARIDVDVAALRRRGDCGENAVLTQGLHEAHGALSPGDARDEHFARHFVALGMKVFLRDVEMPAVGDRAAVENVGVLSIGHFAEHFLAEGLHFRGIGGRAARAADDFHVHAVPHVERIDEGSVQVENDELLLCKHLYCRPKERHELSRGGRETDAFPAEMWRSSAYSGSGR